MDSLADAGYSNYWKVLNSKDYGVPQNRERVFIVSIRKDLDLGEFTFPGKIPLTLKLRDVLEQNADENYYLDDEQTQRFMSLLSQRTEQKQDDKGIKCLGGLYGTSTNTPLAGRVYDPDGLCSTITTPTGGNTQPLILENAVRAENVKIEPNTVCVHPVHREFSGFNANVSPCILARDYKQPKCTVTQDMRIRKLTPKECWRLMGFDDSDIDKCISAGISNTQLYKQAGNSIVVDVLENLFKDILTVLNI